MAIVKATYTKSRGAAKANVRYMEQRPGKDHAKVTRTLFGSDGAMDRIEAYRMIDKAEKGSVFFRIIISPDPKQEDKRRDLHLREITEKTMQTLERRLKQEVSWVAAEHDDHAPHRHVHVLACVTGRLIEQDFEALRLAATEAALFQRQERDLARGRRRERFAQFQSPKTYSAGRKLAAVHRADSIQTCPRCGYGQSMGRGKRPRLYRCPLCGLKLLRDQNISLKTKEAKWEL
jgi:predicted RNA-binding Zn-ribbon protein involved in translation (DUF1610 family)